MSFWCMFRSILQIQFWFPNLFVWFCFLSIFRFIYFSWFLFSENEILVSKMGLLISQLGFHFQNGTFDCSNVENAALAFDFSKVPSGFLYFFSSPVYFHPMKRANALFSFAVQGIVSRSIFLIYQATNWYDHVLGMNMFFLFKEFDVPMAAIFFHVCLWMKFWYLYWFFLQDFLRNFNIFVSPFLTGFIYI